MNKDDGETLGGEAALLVSALACKQFRKVAGNGRKMSPCNAHHESSFLRGFNTQHTRMQRKKMLRWMDIVVSNALAK